MPAPRDTVRRSALAGWAEYGYCASHSRFFWGLRLHLIATLHGLPIGFALTGAKADERQVLLYLLHDEHTLLATRPGQILIADKNYSGRAFEAVLADAGLTLLRRPRKGEPDRAGARFFKPLRQTVESIFDTLKGQLDLEHPAGTRPPASWCASCSPPLGIVHLGGRALRLGYRGCRTSSLCRAASCEIVVGRRHAYRPP